MARVVCECGESFLPYVLNDVPRTQCPFCRRPLTPNQFSNLPQTKPSPPPVPRERAPSAAYPQSSATSQSRALAAQAQLHAEARRVQDNTPARFVTSSNLDGAVTQLRNFVSTEKQKPLQPQAGSNPWFVWGWTLGPALGLLTFEVVTLLILTFANEPPAHPPNYVGLAVMVIGLPCVAGLTGYVIASWFSRCQQRHLCAVVEGAERLGLQFLPRVRVPLALAVNAFPVICPTAPRQRLNEAPRVVDLIASGSVVGNEVHLAHFKFHFDPRDHVPFGSMLKVAQAVARPATALRRQQSWRMYIMAYFTEVLARTPDFLILPNTRDAEAYFVKNRFGSGVFSLVQCANKYLLAVPEAQRGPQLSAELIDLLMREPGWSIQVVGGRLMVWRGHRHPTLTPQWPQSPDHITELVQFASQVRQKLVKHSLAG